MAMESTKRSYEDDWSSESSCPDSPITLPMMMTDENGLQKCIFNERTANELKQKVAFTKKQEQKDLSPHQLHQDMVLRVLMD
jgi:hypothetical protein